MISLNKSKGDNQMDPKCRGVKAYGTQILCLFLCLQVYLGSFLIYPILSAFANEDLKQASAEKIAVLYLQNNTKNQSTLAQLSDFEVQSLTDFLREKFLESPFFVMTQENMMSLLPPDRQMEDCIGKCEVEIGRLLGASHIVSGSVGVFDGKYQMTLRMHHTKNSRLLAQAQSYVDHINQLKMKIPILTQKLLRAMQPIGQSKRDLVVLRIDPISIAYQIKGQINGYPFSFQQLEKIDQDFILPVAPGDQEIVLKLKDHVLQKQKFHFVAEQPKLLYFKFQPQMGQDQNIDDPSMKYADSKHYSSVVEIYTEPADAEILINGERLTEKTKPLINDPTTGYLRLELPAGQHMIEVQKSPFYPIQHKFKLNPNQKLSFKNTPFIFKQKFGDLIIRSEPAQALVRLNGEIVGKTPLIKKQIEAKPYWVEILLNGYQPVEQLVVVDDQQESEIESTLQDSTASIQLQLTYQGAEGIIPVSMASIWLDQKQIGESDSKGFFEMTNLTPGEHLLQIRHTHHLPKYQSIQLQNGKTAQFKIKMDSAFSELEVWLDIGFYEAFLKNPHLRQTLKAEQLQELAEIEIFWGGLLVHQVNLLDPKYEKDLKMAKIKVPIKINAGRKELMIVPKMNGLFEGFRNRYLAKVGQRTIISFEPQSSLVPIQIKTLPESEMAKIALDDEMDFIQTPYLGKISSGIHRLSIESKRLPKIEKLLVILGHQQRVNEVIDLNQATLLKGNCVPSTATLKLQNQTILLNQWVTLLPSRYEISCEQWGVVAKQQIDLFLGDQKSIELRLDPKALSSYQNQVTWYKRIYRSLWVSSGITLLASAYTLWSPSSPYQDALSQRDEFAQKWLETNNIDLQNQYASSWRSSYQTANQWHDLGYAGLTTGLVLGLIGSIMWYFEPNPKRD